MSDSTPHSGCTIDAANLVYRYPDGRLALDDLSLRVEAGERLGIIGPSGAGKSTFLLHLNGVLLPASGEVRIGDLPVRRDTLMQVRSRVGIVFQNPDDQLFTPTVEEDVAFGPLNMGCSPEETHERVSLALRQMRLEGYEKRSTHDLSFGEKRRVALATVLSMRPRVIAFDEPFANLDPGMVEQLVALIRSLDATVVLISQEILPAVAAVDRLAVIHGGKLAAVGPALEIAADRTLLRTCGIDFHYYAGVWEQILSRGGSSSRRQTPSVPPSATGQ
ncbi:MAG: ABC transporter ATP-binding protein [Acidobacteria bacterium]|nr:ABC transporter ATP-binding protein [Acidobacteriota bacterium]